MPHFDIVRKSAIRETFRVAHIMGDFDVKADHANEHFVGDLEMPDEWTVGLIVGGSGTGKTTIARELFGAHIVQGFDYSAASVVDDMPKGCSMDEIERMFYAVGFGSVPSWLKPYSVLSNGEKMRVDLARAILQAKDGETIVFDEFTSVVDRTVAKTACVAIRKSLNRIREVGGAENKVYRGLMSPRCRRIPATRLGFFDGRNAPFCVGPRPRVEFTIRECGIREWSKFRRYHYLNTEIVPQSKCFGLFSASGDQVAFCAVIPQPQGMVRNLRRIHRLVVLPDFQGIGLGLKFLDAVARITKASGYELSIVTSAKNLIKALERSSRWRATRCGVMRMSKSRFSNIDRGRKSTRNRCVTASFRFRG